MKKIIVFSLMIFVTLPAFSQSRSEWKNGYLRFYDTELYETIKIMMPFEFIEEFDGPASTAGAWPCDATSKLVFSTAVNNASIATIASTGGILTLYTGHADDDDLEIASELIFFPTSYPVVEARFKINNTTTCFNFGFSDAKSEGADSLPLMYSGTTLYSTASNCALFFSDYEATTKNYYCAAVNANTDGTVTSTGTAFSAGAWHIYRVEINEVGDCEFWFDGAHIYTETTGIATGTPLCIYFGLMNRAKFVDGEVAFSADIDYVKAWQRR